MKEKKQRSTSNILFHTPPGYYKISGKTFTEIKESGKKEKKQCKKE